MIDDHRRAVRFFWGTLTAATTASIAGNVAHALLNTSTGSPAIAAAASVVPPAVLLGATHGVALLVRARTAGWAYWSALTMTVALAGCAFGLSFDALRGLARRWAGYSEWASYLWPLSIDLSIAVSTLALLALTGAPRRAAVHAVHADASPAQNGALLHQLAEPVTAVADHHAAADELIAAGVVRMERDRAAEVLADLAKGTAPSTVARRQGVGYQVVSRIAAAKASAIAEPTHNGMDVP